MYLFTDICGGYIIIYNTIDFWRHKMSFGHKYIFGDIKCPLDTSRFLGTLIVIWTYNRTNNTERQQHQQHRASAAPAAQSVNSTSSTERQQHQQHRALSRHLDGYYIKAIKYMVTQCMYCVFETWKHRCLHSGWKAIIYTSHSLGRNMCKYVYIQYDQVMCVVRFCIYVTWTQVCLASIYMAQ